MFSDLSNLSFDMSSELLNLIILLTSKISILFGTVIFYISLIIYTLKLIVDLFK